MGDDGAAYSVEVRFDNGTQVEVKLDSEFNVIGQENDDDIRETPTNSETTDRHRQGGGRRAAKVSTPSLFQSPTRSWSEDLP